MTEIRRTAVDQLSAELERACLLIPCPAVRTGHVELLVEPLRHEVCENFAAKMRAANRVFVPDVGIGCAEEQQLHELRQALGAKHLSRDGGGPNVRKLTHAPAPWRAGPLGLKCPP